MNMLFRTCRIFFLDVLLLGLVACQTSHPANELARSSSEQSKCASFFDGRIRGSLSGISLTEQLTSVQADKRPELLAEKIYDALPRSERSAILTVAGQSSIDTDGRLLVGRLQDRFEKLDLCRSTVPYLDVYIFQAQLAEFLYQNKIDVESIYADPKLNTAQFGNLSSADLLLVSLVKHVITAKGDGVSHP